jgi:phosphate transport system permease protein
VTEPNNPRPDFSKSGPPGSLSLRNRSGRSRRFWEGALEQGIRLVAIICVLIIFLIFVFVFKEAAPILTGKLQTTHAVVEDLGEMESYGEAPEETELHVELVQREAGEGEKLDLPHLAGPTWQPTSLTPRFGLLPLFVGTLKVTLVALLIAVPVGVMAALYTASFAPKWVKEIMKPTIEILAGIPSVVIGFFALVILASLLQSVFGTQYRLNALVGGLALSFAVIPIIYTVSEDALATIPRSLTEASLALGATRFETAWHVVLPAALPGVVAAALLGLGRAFGETMIVLMATGNAALLTPSLVEPVRTLSATIGAEMAEVVFGDTHYTVLFFIGTLLFLVSFALNALAEIFVRGFLLKRFRGMAS